MGWFDPTREWGRYPNSIPKIRVRTRTRWKIMSSAVFVMCGVGGLTAGLVAWRDVDLAVRNYQTFLTAQGVSYPSEVVVRQVAMWGAAGWVSAVAAVAWIRRVVRELPLWASISVAGASGGAVAAWGAVHPSIAIAAGGIIAIAAGRRVAVT